MRGPIDRRDTGIAGLQPGSTQGRAYSGSTLIPEGDFTIPVQRSSERPLFDT
jgi:hypothetical protein